MKIAILNIQAFSPQVLAALRRFGPLAMHPKATTAARARRALRDADIAIVNGALTPLTETSLDKSPRLKLIILNSTGYDFIDTAACRRRNIAVANTPDFSTQSVAEHAIGLMLAVQKKIVAADLQYRRNHSALDPTRPASRYLLGSTLSGKRIGIIGFGTIGRRVAKIVAAFGMEVLACDIPSAQITLPAKRTDFAALIAESHVISLHVPLNQQTRNIIGAREIARMRRDAILINTARGGLVNTPALFRALRHHRIAGAGLDVVAGELPPLFLNLPNVVFTPHTAWWTSEALEEQARIIMETVNSFLRGRPAHIVN